MVGSGHCPMISKYGPSLSKAVGPVDPSFLVVKISHFNKNRQNKDLNKNSGLMKVKRIAECSPWSILQYFRPALSNNWSSFLSGCLRKVLLYNQQSLYIYMHTSVCVSV